MLRLAQATHALRRPIDRLSGSRTCSRFSQVTAIGLWAIAASNPDLPAVISPDGGVVSYAELAREADRYGRGLDRKSTRLNSSHPSISYAVFCLKKKKK